MSLTVRLKNIGILKQAEFSLGDLTLICGENNTGKTYSTYALYGFLGSWRDFIQIPISETEITRVLEEGGEIESRQETDQLLAEACKEYTKQLDEIFAASAGTFQDSQFSLLPDIIDTTDKEFNDRIESHQGHLFWFYLKCKASGELTVTVQIEKNPEKEFNVAIAKKDINIFVANAIFAASFPRSFIFSAERTGISIFRKELDFGRNRLFRGITGILSSIVSLGSPLFKEYLRYPSPIEDNVDFTRQLEDIAKNKSFIAKEHPDILDDFADIVGGTYTITSNDQLYYIPKGTRHKLTMVESSSAARALLDLSFYLNCIAEKGDLLMIDEPELSLHPENQRRIARLFARLANIGVKVFVTTHSDYIVKELNTLIMLNHDKPHLKRVAEENGYQDSELIKADQVKVYIAEKALLPLEEGKKRRKRGHTLVPAKIHPKFGIGVSSFDKTIDDMNRIQDDIVWGEE